MNNIIYRRIKTATVWFLILNILLLLALTVLTYIVAPYSYGLISEPALITWEELESLEKTTTRELFPKTGVNLLGVVVKDYNPRVRVDTCYLFLTEPSNRPKYDLRSNFVVTNGKKALHTTFSKEYLCALAPVGYLIPKNYNESVLYDNVIGSNVIDYIIKYSNDGEEKIRLQKMGSYEEMTRYKDGNKIRKGALLNFKLEVNDSMITDFLFIMSVAVFLLWTLLIRNFVVIIIRFMNPLKHPAIKRISDLKSFFGEFEKEYKNDPKYIYESENWVVEQKLSKLRVSRKWKKLDNFDSQYAKPYRKYDD